MLHRPMIRSSSTLSVLGEDESGESSELRPCLFFVVGCDDLAQPSVRFELDGTSTLEIGRGHRSRPASREGSTRIVVPDPRMSGRHARLLPSKGGFVFEDLGSKNGSRLNGEPVERPLPLSDGDVLELGHSFLVVRLDAAWEPEPGDGRPESDGPLATLYAGLARRFRALERVATGDLSIMIGGETGVGKEVVARAVHASSGRTGDFVPVNCGALPAGLVEGELFGSARGAFSGADRDRPGLVRSADRGTLFLDEIGELSASAQASLLRVLQERTVTPLGEARPVPVDFRLVTATHRDLREAVAVGSFRGDLLARIRGFEIDVPPLRDRRQDIGLLLRRILRECGADPRRFRLTLGLARALLAYHWPYNVREMKKAIELAMTVSEAGVLSRDALRFDEGDRPGGEPTLSADDEVRRRELIELLEAHGGNVSQVARTMGKARMQVHRWLKKYGIDPSHSRRRP
jgi:hypothetical protein